LSVTFVDSEIADSITIGFLSDSIATDQFLYHLNIVRLGISGELDKLIIQTGLEVLDSVFKLGKSRLATIAKITLC
jgi:uncharacterized protein YfaA (DUF2138 family)